MRACAQNPNLAWFELDLDLLGIGPAIKNRKRQFVVRFVEFVSKTR